MDDRTREPAVDPTAASANDPDRPSAKGAVGGAVGGVSGAAAGAAAGTITAGPVGTIIGAIVGAVGGGWAGLATAQAAAPSEEDERYYREHHGQATAGQADASYDRVRPAYHLGHVAALNPDYDGRTFEEVEADLRHGWTDDVRTRHGEWAGVRGHVRAAYERTLTRRNANPGSMHPDPLGGTSTHQRAEFNDRLASDAPVAGNPNAPVTPTAGAPEHSDAGSPPWMRSASDQGGFGTHMEPRNHAESDRES